MPSLTTATADVLTRMLRRLPPSLWDTDPQAETLQRDLYRAFAEQMAIWLENREIARTMTLLREAAGTDLDVLLEDYGLRRYLQRPDAYARQVGLHILWHPQGTLDSVRLLADLLFDQPHVTMRTGRSEQHVFVADTHPVTTPYSYWGLVSDEGLWYAVTVDHEVPTLSQAPPPGLDTSPGAHTLRWFTVLDENAATWYVTVHGDTLTVSQVQSSGYGTTEPFSVLDGQGSRWFLSVLSGSEALVTTRDSGLTPFGYWQLTSYEGTPYRLWIEAEEITFDTTSPGGTTDQTPTGGPFRWLQVQDETGGTWYVWVQESSLMTAQVSPGGPGITTPFEIFDVTGQRWTLSVRSGSEALVTTAENAHNADLVVVTPAHPSEALQLVDSAGVSWWLWVNPPNGQFSRPLPLGATDVTPAGGPYRWLRLYDLDGTLWYLYPSTAGVLTLSTTNPGGLGTAQPQALGDVSGVLWHYGVTSTGTFGISDSPNVEYGGLATTVCLNDAEGKRWFWRVQDGHLEWSRELWPDACDQSPWGELSWLKMQSTTSVDLYVYPSTLGIPTAAAAPPAGAYWGWQEPVTLVDTDGVAWQLRVRPTTAGQPEYWRLVNPAGGTAYLWIDAEEPTTQPAIPSGGVDVTPTTLDLDWFLVSDEQGFPWWTTVRHDTLFPVQAVPGGTITRQPFFVQDALGGLWLLEARQGSEALISLRVDTPWRVDVVPAPVEDIPALATPIQLRDAVEAFSHIQAAGSLLTVLVT